VASSGLPGYESAAIQGIFAPAHTPPALIKRLNQEFLKVLGRPELRERFAALGTVAVGSTPEQLTAAMKADIATLGKLIRDAGIRED
jgi:tripartite-type tricarboxylate transporter receptor subunit TctC